MANASISNVRVAGIAACVPRHAESNREYAAISADERLRIIQGTGIERRRIATNGECTSDLCFHAAQRLIDELQWNREEIDGVVLVTQTPDHPLPATAAILQDRLGLPKTALAFDVNLAHDVYISPRVVSQATVEELNRQLAASQDEEGERRAGGRPGRS